MTRRWAWLLTFVLGATALPGCASLFGKLSPAEAQAVDEYIVPPPPMPVDPVVPAGAAEPAPAEADTLPTPNEAPPRPALPEAPLIKPDEKTTGTLRPAKYAEPTGTAEPTGEAEKVEPAGKYAPLVEALQCILDERHPEALKHLQAYDQETQEFYLRVLPTLTIFAKKRLDQLTPQEVAVLNDQLQSLLAQLRPRAELVIDKMCFCRRSEGYGYYEPLPENYAFLASTPDRVGELVQLYVEVRNFASVKRDGYYEVRLRSVLEIRDAKGEKVITTLRLKEEAPRRSRTRLNDFSNSYGFYMPAEVPPGTYQLVLQIEDATTPEARRVTRKAIEFRVTPVARRTAARP